MNPAKKKFTKKIKSPLNLHEKTFINTWSDYKISKQSQINNCKVTGNKERN